MFLLLIPLIFGGIGAAIASSKNLNPVAWGLLCFLLPVLGLLILIFQRPQLSRAQEIANALAAAVPASGGTRAIAGAAVGTNASARWKALVEYDRDIGAANDAVQPYGQQFVDMLANEYFVLNDKSYLPAIQSKVIAAAEEYRKDPLSALRETRPTRNGAIGDVVWTYYADDFFVGERAGVKKRFKTLEELKSYYARS